MKTILVAFLWLSYASCSTLDRLDEVSIPVELAGVIGAQIVEIVAESDLDGDGFVTGLDELREFVLAIYEAVRVHTDDTD